MFLALYGGLCLMFCFVWKRVIFYGMVWMQLSCFIEVFYNQCQIWNIAACRISLGNTKAVKMEEWCYVSGRRKILFTVLSFPRWTSNVTLFNKFDQNQSFVSLPQFDDSEQASKSAVRIIHLPVVTLHINMQSSSGARGGWLLHLVVILPFLSALVLLWIWPGCYLRSCWQKSARTNPTLNFQQRRENTSAVIQFNVVLFELSSRHISVKLFCNNVTHTHTDTHWFIDYIMSPAVMFQSNVHSLIV